MIDPEFRKYVSGKLDSRTMQPLKDTHPIFDPSKLDRS